MTTTAINVSESSTSVLDQPRPSRSPQRNAAPHILGLDVLRLAAAALVIAYHFCFWNWTRGQPLSLALPGQQPRWGESLYFGWVGVEVFFVISGFVISYSANGVPRQIFLRNRFMRLAPVSWLSASVALLFGLMLSGSDLPRLTLLYAETLVFWPFNAIDGVWWTLGVEVDFYLLAYILIGRSSTWSLERVMSSIGLLSGAFWAVALALQTELSNATGYLGLLHTLVIKAEGNRELQLLLVQHGCLFALGVVMQSAASKGLTRSRLITGVSLAGACWLEIIGQNGIINRASQTAHSAALPAVVWLAVMALLIGSYRYNAHLQRLAGTRTRWLRFAGLLTYPLYLLHNVVGVAVSRALAPVFGLSAVALAVAIAVAVAATVAAFAEPPLRALLAAWVWPVRPADVLR